MRTPFIRTARWLMLLVIAAEFPAVGQVLSTANATNTPSSAVAMDIRVLAVPGSGLREAGLYFPDDEGSIRPGGFAIVLPEGEAEALAKDPQTVSIHSLRLQPKPVGPAKFRVEARTPVRDAYPVNPPYFEVALGFEVTSRIVSQKNVALSTLSVVQIRRGPGEQGTTAALLLETAAIRHDVQVPQGKTILLGGFFTPSDASRLPEMPQTPESPLLHYVLSKGPRGAQHSEIVVLLTPRLVDSVESVPRMPLITEAVTNPSPSRGVPVTAPAPATPPPSVQLPEPRPTEMKAVISALVTTPEVVSPPMPPLVTVRPAPELPPMATLRPSPPIAKLAPAPLAKRDTRPSYSVQAGAFRSSEKADSLMGRLQNQFDDVFVEETPGVPTPYRVRIGPLPTLAAAKQVRQQLNKRGIDSFVVSPASR